MSDEKQPAVAGQVERRVIRLTPMPVISRAIDLARSDLPTWDAMSWEVVHEQPDGTCWIRPEGASNDDHAQWYPPGSAKFLPHNAVVQARGAQTIEEGDDGRPASRATEG